MINWDNYKIGQELNLKITATNSVANLKVKISDFEWAPNRTLHLSDVEVLETNGDYKAGDVLRLPLVVGDKPFQFLVVKHDKCYHEVIKEGLISLN
jgi:hypothetical protein